ncbi:O-methyltransferase-domain-containing protein [Tricharina praecox]|uniref:O-methyltransferase-domain-containing protein n=1 Tax=Tricharina praecox TaxID=43433 RepID=UPI00221F30D2|nr:O-methyltransferase-domain-containing protein [Tricharina praecox]KAI5849925.1 O-methyltransferase-domain-containing protein [Tricharina praecox]
MSLTAIATEILKHAQALDVYIAEHDLPQPSFDRDGPAMFPLPGHAPDSLHKARTALMDASKTIYDLTEGPTNSVMWGSIAVSNHFTSMTLRALNSFCVADAVPLTDEGASYAEIAAATGVDEEVITRIVRHATTMRIFDEFCPGRVRHTASSRAMKENQLLKEAMKPCLEEGFQSAAHFNEAVAKFGGVEECKTTAFNIAFDTDDNYFTFIQRPEEQHRGKYLAGMMRYMWKYGGTAGKSHTAEEVLAGFDWAKLEGGLVVDVGGSHGSVEAALAPLHKELKFIVQDLPPVVELASANFNQLLPNAEDNCRVSFMAHSFFDPQPVKDADVYFFRHIMHDWSDTYCAKILKNIIPSMKKGARIVIVDYVLPDPGSAPKTPADGENRCGDLFMMSLLGGKERGAADWHKLVKLADDRLKILNINLPDNQVYGVIEIALDEE